MEDLSAGSSPASTASTAFTSFSMLHLSPAGNSWGNGSPLSPTRRRDRRIHLSRALSFHGVHSRSTIRSSSAAPSPVTLSRSVSAPASLTPNHSANPFMVIWLSTSRLPPNHRAKVLVDILLRRPGKQLRDMAIVLLHQLCSRAEGRAALLQAAEPEAAEALVNILLEGLDRQLCKQVMGLLDLLCECAEGRAGLLGHESGLAAVSRNISRVSNKVTDRGVRILGSVSKYSLNDRVLVEMFQVGAVAKLYSVSQGDCSWKTKKRAKQIMGIVGFEEYRKYCGSLKTKETDKELITGFGRLLIVFPFIICFALILFFFIFFE